MRRLTYQLLAAVLATACCGDVRAETPMAATSGSSAVAAGAVAPVVAVAPARLELAALGVAGLQFSWFNGDISDNLDRLKQASSTRWRQQNYNLTLAGRFAAPVHQLFGGQWEKIVTDTGEDLMQLKGRDFYPSLRQQWANNKAQPATAFTLYLNLPPPGMKTTMIRELSGQMFCTTHEKSRMVNLGLTTFEAGAKGTVFDAQIDAIDEPQQGEMKTLKLTLSGLPPELFGDFKFYDEGGAELAVQSAGWMMGPNAKTFLFNRAGGFPAKGRIEVEVFEKMEVAFKLENIPLFGRPAVNGFGLDADALAASRSAVAASAAQPEAADATKAPPWNVAPEGVFQPAPEGLGLVTVAATGFNATWFDVEDWVATNVSTKSSRGRRAAGKQGSFYILNLAGKFSGPMFKIQGSTVDKIVTDTGEELLDPKAGNFNLFLSQRWENGRMQGGADFQGSLRLAAPGAKTTALKELSGQVFYTSRGTSGKMVDLGLAEFKKGAKGTEFGACLTSLEGQNGECRRLQIKLDKRSEEVGIFKFYDATGAVLTVHPQGQSSGASSKNGSTTEFAFYNTEPFPAKGRIEVEIFDDVKNLVAPFRLENVPLYGRPSRPGA